MIHIFANIAKAWPYLLNYSSLQETLPPRNSTTAEMIAADEKLKSYELFNDEPYTIDRIGGGNSMTKDSASSLPLTDKETEASIIPSKKEELDSTDYYRMKRKVKMGNFFFFFF